MHLTDSYGLSENTSVGRTSGHFDSGATFHEQQFSKCRRILTNHPAYVPTTRFEFLPTTVDLAFMAMVTLFGRPHSAVPDSITTADDVLLFSTHQDLLTLITQMPRLRFRLCQ